MMKGNFKFGVDPRICDLCKCLNNTGSTEEIKLATNMQIIW